MTVNKYKEIDGFTLEEFQFDDDCIQEDGYQEFRTFSEEELQKLNKTKLIELIRKRKAIDNEAISVLSSMADPEHKNDVYDLVSKMHELILENDKELNELFEDGFLSKEQSELFSKSKHERFFRSSDIFEEHSENPVQKAMVRKKCIGKRKIKKSKTPGQHISCLSESKRLFLLEKKVSMLDKKVEDINARVSRMEAMSEVHAEVTKVLLQSRIKDRQIAMYQTKLDNPNLTQKELADMYGVTTRSIRNWINDINIVLLDKMPNVPRIFTS